MFGQTDFLVRKWALREGERRTSKEVTDLAEDKSQDTEEYASNSSPMAVSLDSFDCERTNQEMLTYTLKFDDLTI